MFNIRETRIIQHNVRNYSTNKSLLHSNWDEEDPDVILLNSICINPNNDNQKIEYKNYKTYSTPKGLHNGSAILVKKDIKHAVTRTGDEQLLAVTLNTTGGLITLATFYRPFDDKKPNSKIPHHLFNRLFNRSHPVVLMGDLNLKHKSLGMSCKANPQGNDFAKYCLNNKSNIFYEGPSFNTWFDRGKKSKCDIVLFNRAAQELHQFITQGKQLGSDHTVVRLTVSSTPICLDTPPIPDESKANWKLFKNTLEKHQLPNVNNIDKDKLDGIIVNFLSTIQSTLANEDIFPLKNKKFIQNVPVKSHKTQQIEQCIHNFDAKLRQQMGPTTAPQTTIKNNLYKSYKNSRSDDFEAYYQGIANNINGSLNSNNFWDKINKSKGNFTNNKNSIKVENQTITDENLLPNIFKECWVPVWKSNPPTTNPKAAAIAKTYEDWHQNEENIHRINPHTTTDNSRLLPPSKEDLKNNYYKSQLLAPIEPDDVKDFISQLKKKKSPGKTGITNKMLKNLPKSYIHYLTHIYNAALSMGYFPDCFKKAIVKMIPKKGKCSDNPLNYRPISLLEPIGKIYEQILNRRLKTYLEDNNLLNDLQFGFRSGRSTHTSIHTMLEYITQSHKRGLDVFLLSKDIEKAFDKVHHPSLIYKIFNNFGLPDLFCKTLANFLIDRTIEIKINGICSDPFSPKSGVPQGSVLGPLLYLMFINDAPRPKKSLLAKTEGYRSEINSYFADDNIIMTSGIQGNKPKGNSKGQFGNKRFREIVQEMSDWEEAHRIKTNASKSALMFISHKTKPFSKHLTLHPLNKAAAQQQISYKTSHKILGINFDRKLNFVNHIKQLKHTIKQDVRSLRILKRTNFETKTFLFKTLMQPKISYSYPIYHLLSRQQKLELQACQNIPIYKFVLSNIPFDQHPNSEHMHVKMHLKSTAQVAWERGRKFHKTLKQRSPDLYNMFEEYSLLPSMNTKNSRIRKSPMEFAKGLRPTFYYSEDHYTVITQ